jgi:hypothetical protein
MSNLREENHQLAEKVKRLVLLESQLNKNREALETQNHINNEILKSSQRLNNLLNLKEIVSVILHFVLYTANLERCLVLLQSADEKYFTVHGVDGYYEEKVARKLNRLKIPYHHPAIEPLFKGSPYILCPEVSSNPETVEFGQGFDMIEFDIIPISGETQTQSVFLSR